MPDYEMGPGSGAAFSDLEKLERRARPHSIRPNGCLSARLNSPSFPPFKPPSSAMVKGGSAKQANASTLGRGLLSIRSGRPRTRYGQVGSSRCYRKCYLSQS